MAGRDPERDAYDYHWHHVTRPRILRRAAYECERCGAPDRPMGLWSALDIAHLTVKPGNEGHDQDDNLAALCRRCHRATDYQEWVALFRAWLEKEKERRMDEKDKLRPILQMGTIEVSL